jgi:glycosyltransferase involved in cell wall biosynthesis
MSTLKVAMVAPFALEPKGTVRTRMIPIAKELKKRGYSVDIVVPPWDNISYSEKIVEIDSIKIYHVKSDNPSYFNGIITVIRLCEFIKKLNPDIIHIFKPIGYSGFTGLWFSLIKSLGASKIPVIVDTDDWEGDGGQNNRSTYSPVVKWIISRQERVVLKTADSVTVASKALQTLAWGLGIAHDKVLYAPNGQYDMAQTASNIDNSRIKTKYNLDNNQIILLYTRFFEFDLKRVVRIFKKIKSEVGSAKLFVVGQGRFGEEKKFHSIIKEEGLESSTIMVGWVNFKELPDYISVADLAIYPFDDTLINRAKCPVKLTELMLKGLPIVADRVGQIQEYIEHGASGLLSDPDDVDEFSKNVVNVLKNKSLANTLGANARYRILDKFGWGAVANQIELVYKNSCNGWKHQKIEDYT